MWNIEKLEVVASMPAHDNPVCTLTINGNRLYSGSLKSIKVNLKFKALDPIDLPNLKLLSVIIIIQFFEHKASKVAQCHAY